MHYIIACMYCYTSLCSDLRQGHTLSSMLQRVDDAVQPGRMRRVIKVQQTLAAGLIASSSSNYCLLFAAIDLMTRHLLRAARIRIYVYYALCTQRDAWPSCMASFTCVLYIGICYAYLLDWLIRTWFFSRALSELACFRLFRHRKKSTSIYLNSARECIRELLNC